MRHDAARELLPLHAIGVVNASDAAEVSRHIATCRQCGQEAEIYAFAAAALDSIAGADPAVLHSSDPLPPLAGPALDRIAADVFNRLGSYAPEWPGGVADAAPASDPAAMWGLTSEDADTAGDLIRGIANQDELALQDSAGFAESVTLQDMDGDRVSRLPELRGQSRGTAGWVGPGDASIIGLADEEWPSQEAALPQDDTAAPEMWPQDRRTAEEPAGQRLSPARSEWESEVEDDADDSGLEDDWSELATGEAPPASALLDEATTLRNVISRLKANTGSSGPPPLPDDASDEETASAGFALDARDEDQHGGFERGDDQAATPVEGRGQQTGDGRRGFGAFFRRSRREEPADGTWDDLFQESEPVAAAGPRMPAASSAPMLAGARNQDPPMLEQPGDISRPPLPPSWLARNASPSAEGGSATGDSETLDSWAELAGTTLDDETGAMQAGPPAPLLDEPIAPEEVEQIPPAAATQAAEAASPPISPAWVVDETVEESDTDETDDWADLLGGDAEPTAARADEPSAPAVLEASVPPPAADTPVDEPARAEPEAGDVETTLEPEAPAVEADDGEEFDDDWADLLNGTGDIAEMEESKPAPPAVAIELPSDSNALDEIGEFDDASELVPFAALPESEALGGIEAPEDGPAEDESLFATTSGDPGGDASGTVSAVHATSVAWEGDQREPDDAATPGGIPDEDFNEDAVAALVAGESAESALVEDLDDDWADLFSGEDDWEAGNAEAPGPTFVADALNSEDVSVASEEPARTTAEPPASPATESTADGPGTESGERAEGAAALERNLEEAAIVASGLESDEEIADDWADLFAGVEDAAESGDRVPTAASVAEVIPEEVAREAVDGAAAAAAPELPPGELSAAPDPVATATVPEGSEILTGQHADDVEATVSNGAQAHEDDDDFADSWAGLALAEDDQERVADEAFAMAALEEPETARDTEATAFLAKDGEALPGTQPIARGGRGRFGFLRRDRKQDEERTAPEPSGAADAEALQPDLDTEPTDVAWPPATPEMGEAADAVGSAAERSVVHDDAYAPPESIEAVAGPTATDVAEPSSGIANATPAEVTQASLFDLESHPQQDDSAGGDVAVQPVGSDGEPRADETPIEEPPAAGSEERSESDRRRRFGWLRRAIPGGEDIEDDWATVARSAPEVQSDGENRAPDALETAPEKPADILAEDAASVASVGTPDTPVVDDVPFEATTHEGVERAASGSDAADVGGELDLEAPDGVADEVAMSAAAPSRPETVEPEPLSGVSDTMESAIVEDEGSLDDLFAESTGPGDEAGARDDSPRLARRRFGWFRGRRDEEEDAQEPDEWATVAAEPVDVTEADALVEDSEEAETGEETAVPAAEHAPKADAQFDTAQLTAEAAPEAERGTASPEMSEPDFDEAMPEPPTEDADEAPQDVPRSASPPPSRHRLRDMMRRRRSPHRASDEAAPGDTPDLAEAPPVSEEPPPVAPEPEPEPSYLVEELEELAPPDEESGRARRRRGTGPARRHIPGEREATGAQRGALRRALGRQRETDGEEDEEAAISPWAEVLRKPERPPSAPLAGAFATPYIPGPVDWGLERYDDDEPDLEGEAEVASSSWRFWTVMFGITTVVLFGLLIGGIVMLVNLRQESQQLEVAKDAAAVPITFTSADPDVYSGEGYLERERGQALLTLKGITGAEQGQQYVIWADNGTGTVTPVAWTTGRSSSTVQYIPLNRVPRDVQRIYITLETFTGRPEAPPIGEILLEAPTP